MNTTFDLKDAIEDVVSKRYITKTLSRVFQSIRIAVNKEFVHLDLFLNNALKIC